ncbi:MAG: hypothetical protein ACXVQR_05795 [Solirubrobacteraceae bacterium]
MPAEDVDASEITALGRDDVLFVDTTHTVKSGGDVTRIVLDLLPLVASGVLVHFHDIFLPYGYPSAWVLEERRAWAEQYLLQAFLAFKAAFEVVFPAYAVVRRARRGRAGDPVVLSRGDAGRVLDPAGRVGVAGA